MTNKFATDSGVAGIKAEADRWYRLYCEKEKEVERVARDYQEVGQNWGEAEARADKAEAEIERLQAELEQRDAKWTRTMHSYETEIERLKLLQSPSLFAEVERLKQRDDENAQLLLTLGDKMKQAEARLAKVVLVLKNGLLLPGATESWRASARSALAAAQPCHPECVGIEMPPGNLWCNAHNMERDCPKDASCPKCRPAQPEKPAWHYCSACARAHVGYITSACELAWHAAQPEEGTSPKLPDTQSARNAVRPEEELFSGTGTEGTKCCT